MIVNIADLRDPDDPQGRSYRQVNAEKSHSIPLGTLVELPSGVRLFVVFHGRDCDQTPLYYLSADRDDNERSKTMTHEILKQSYDDRIAQIDAAERAEKAAFTGKFSEWAGKSRVFRERREAAYQEYLEASARLNGYESFAAWQADDSAAFQAHQQHVQREITEADDYDG